MINNYLESNKVRNGIIFFCNTGCFPCEILEKELTNINVNIYKVNIDTQLEVAKQYDITSLPTLLFIKDEKEVYRFNGVRSLKDINKVLLHFNIQ